MDRLLLTILAMSALAAVLAFLLLFWEMARMTDPKRLPRAA